MSAISNFLEVQTLEEWHAWLVENHQRVNEVWLVYRKPKPDKTGIQYEESVEEALCFGWVDSLIKAMDEEKYARKFTPRKPGSRWSSLNISRAQRMLKQGRMTEYGLKYFEEGIKQPDKGGLSRKEQMEVWRQEMVERMDPQTRTLFDALPPSLQGQYAGWVMSGKRVETQQKRLAELIGTLARGERLGLK